MSKLLPIFCVAFMIGATSGFPEDAPTIAAVLEAKDRIRNGDTRVIAELEAANTPDSVALLAHIVYLYSGGGAQERYPGVWQAAAQSLARMPGACEIIGEKCVTDVRLEKDRMPSFSALTRVRNEEAVRVVGNLLFDEYDIYYGPSRGGPLNLGSNAGYARLTFVGWLSDFPEFKEKLGLNDTRAWQNWWNERKHDPATIRAIAEGRRPPDVVPPPPAPPEAPVPAAPVAPQQEPAAPSTSASPEPKSPPPGFWSTAGVALVACAGLIAGLVWLRQRGKKNNV